ncbi:uncharacterized protein LOC131434154 [Malaya genurostris]|uniref:uncharacterized protein LOC131434154 n=1 Tax=Malaya genurostris TaxID=325434 RepID=UPI0026F3AAAD|nr:uncharacterized protein LOC131434154 [Malaya genurostris]
MRQNPMVENMKSVCSSRSSLVYAGMTLLLLSTTSASSANISQQKTNQLQNQPDPVPLSNDFDWKLVKEVFQHEQTNTIFSPFSIKLLLTLLHEASGKNSTTERELSKALSGSDLNRTRQLYREFLESSTKENKDYEFNIGTRIFMDQSIANVTDAYTELVESCYKTTIEPVTFRNSTATATKINDWCAKITLGHLNDLVTEDHIQDASMVIANALFLKASWKNSFTEEYTQKRPFHVADSRTEDVEFMEQTNIYEYLDDQDLQLEILKLPYKGRHFSLYLVLPYVNNTLEKAIALLSTDSMFKLQDKLGREEIVVIIPKFKFDFGIAMNDYLKTLGISEIFTRKANLPQLSGGKISNLEVSKILQKAGIEVNERGTLAFAATEIQLVNKFGIDDSPIQFEANRPFMFYIKDEDSDAILFVGKVLNPVATKEFKYNSQTVPLDRSHTTTALVSRIRSPASVTSVRSAFISEFCLTYSWISLRTVMIITNKFLWMVLLISIVCSSNGGISLAKRRSGIIRSRYIDEEPEPTRNDEFDWQLIKKTFNKEPTNAALSTFLVKYLLNILYEGTGTNSQTQRELSNPLGRTPGNFDVPNCVEIMNTLRNNSKRLHVASRVFADQLISVTQKYASTVALYYDASVVQVDFQQPQQAAEVINGWVSNGTQGQIQEVINARDIQGSVLVLASTIYFKGLWRNVFPESATVDYPFKTSDGRTINVPSMKQIQNLYYSESTQLKAKLLRLPYEEGRYTMILLLPDEDSNLNQLINALSGDAIHQAIRDMEDIEVKVQLPRFKIDFSNSMKEALQQLGINRIFEDNAELSGIARGSSLPLKASDIFQKTVIVVDEKGSTASSAAGSSLVYTIASDPEKFVVDRPFLFFIEEESTGTLLFAGKVEDPLQ